MHTIRFDKRYRLLLCVIGLLVLLQVQAIAQYGDNPPNDIIYGYTIHPFFPANGIYICTILPMLYRDIRSLIEKDYEGHYSFGYFLLLALGLVGSLLIIGQSTSILEFYHGNGRIYPGTYLPLIVQSIHILAVIGFGVYRRFNKYKIRMYDKYDTNSI